MSAGCHSDLDKCCVLARVINAVCMEISNVIGASKFVVTPVKNERA